MIDTPQTRLERKMRLGGSSVLRHIGQTPRGIISAGSKRQTMSILGATGFDAHVSLSSPLAIGERVTLMMGVRLGWLRDWEPGDCSLGEHCTGLVRTGHCSAGTTARRIYC